MGHALIACEWDHPSSEWARGWGPYIYDIKIKIEQMIKMSYILKKSWLFFFLIKLDPLIDRLITICKSKKIIKNLR